jgi:hypothetical protein
VLLCIDGADLDDVVLPLVRRGELPAFASLLREGTWGPLATFEPTLSPVVWTTLITGKRPDQHGIHQFTAFRFPGISRAVFEFPLHTGLNFTLIPWIERIPGVPPLQVPVTSNLRRVKALWNIVGDAAPVGVYQWRVSWPAERVNGFAVASGGALVNFLGEATPRDGFFHPPSLLARIPPSRPPIADLEKKLEPYVGSGWEADPRDPSVQTIIASLDTTDLELLLSLIADYRPSFVAAAFFNVDPFSHLFATHRGKGGIYSNAIDERYRFTDARLGELLAKLGPGVNVIVVSDHGYDFVNNHHVYAPAGMFMARGPAFAPGRRVDGLSVYDIAPLVLYLLDLPLALDMPGTTSRAYRKAVDDALLAARGERFVDSYEEAGSASYVPVASPVDEKILRELRSLGYLD